MVREKRQYRDQSKDRDRFEWVLEDITTMETEIILLIKRLTGRKVEFTPTGWFVEQLEKEVIATATPLKTPLRK